MTSQREKAILEGVGPSAWKKGISSRWMEETENRRPGHDMQPCPLRQFFQGPA